MPKPKTPKRTTKKSLTMSLYAGEQITRQLDECRGILQEISPDLAVVTRTHTLELAVRVLLARLLAEVLEGRPQSDSRWGMLRDLLEQGLPGRNPSKADEVAAKTGPAPARPEDAKPAGKGRKGAK